MAHPKAPKPEGYSGLDLYRGAPGPADIDRHNERIDQYYLEYENYLRALDKFEDLQRRIIPLNVVLQNGGFSPAEDIDISVHLPGGMFVADKSELLIKPPVEPMAPEGPKSAMQERAERISGVAVNAPFDRFLNLIEPEILGNVSRPTIRRTNSFEIQFHVGELKHTLQAEFDTLFVLFYSWDSAKSFTIPYRLLAANVPEPVTDELHVIVEIAESIS
jgi:hypothetical protein